MFILSKNQIITLTIATVFFAGNDIFMNYLSRVSPAEIDKVGAKVAVFENIGSRSVYADTGEGNKIISPSKPERVSKPNFTIYESRILKGDNYVATGTDDILSTPPNI